jgi:hypothetical protein
MSTLNDIFKKLEDKTELASHQVELALVDDVSKLLTRMKAIDAALMKSTQKAVNSLSAFAKVQGDLKDAYATASLDSDDAQNDIKEAVLLIDRVAKQAKELGLNPNDVKGTQDIVKITENLEDTINTLNKNEADIKSILSI